jgi:hypothetical protein
MNEPQKIVSVYTPDEYFEAGHRLMQKQFKLQHYWVSRLNLRRLADGGVCRVYTGGMGICGIVGSISGGVFGWAGMDFVIGAGFFGVLGIASCLLDRFIAKEVMEHIVKSNPNEPQEQMP